MGLKTGFAFRGQVCKRVFENNIFCPERGRGPGFGKRRKREIERPADGTGGRHKRSDEYSRFFTEITV